MLQSEQDDTGKRDAVQFNSGEPVGHSGPGLNGPTNPPTLGLKPGACPSVQPKSGWGSGGEAPSIGIGRADASSLDPLEINRNKLSQRGKHCGRFSFRGFDRQKGHTRFIRVNCGTFGCAYCGPRKAKRYRWAIRHKAEQLKLRRFLSLTLDPAKVEGDPVRYLNQTWAKMRVYLSRQYGHVRYIRVLEFQRNGNPHLHILIDRYIPQAWIKASWQSLGGGRIVDIRLVSVHRISRYLSKYLTKELLLSAPKRCRRVTTSRDIHLFEKFLSEIVWELVRLPIFALAKAYSKEITSTEYDEEGVIQAIDVFETRD